MSFKPSTVEAAPDVHASAPTRDTSRRTPRAGRGSDESLVWLTGGALLLSLAMIAALLALILIQGLGSFWPSRLVELRTADGHVYLGEIIGHETYLPEDARPADSIRETAQQRAAEATSPETLTRRLVRTGNFDLSATHFHWVDDALVVEQSQPEWACVIERRTWGRFYGTPQALLIDNREVAVGPAETWERFVAEHPATIARREQATALARDVLGAAGRRRNRLRLDVVRAERAHGTDAPAHAAAVAELARFDEWHESESARVMAQIDAMRAENARYAMRLVAADGQEVLVPLEEIVRAYPANRLTGFERAGVYFSRWGEFLSDAPREANSEGGVLPAIWGTVVMTLVMSIAVVPFGVLAALYLHEYARGGLVVSTLRIAVNNLAGVPSIVFGVFGLGFFCYVVGVRIDELFFPAELAEHTPTFGTGGLLWASLTLALLTLPVVIVTTEEALAAVPGSMREGSYGCGASKWQTIWRIVLPRALPGVMTGVILAIARGAGEVAPLMLVGAVKSAPELPLDGVFPFLHPQRSFMHLGFHLYDLGFHSQNSDAARPMVFTTALVLITIVALLNVTAMWMRARLRRRLGAHLT